MKALSVRQPYAYAIINGYKPVENRDWYSNYRGWLLIHAAKKEEKEDIEEVLLSCAEQAQKPYREIFQHYEESKALGCIIGCVNLIDCVTNHDSDWFFGPYGFVMTDPRACMPVEWKGQLGLFDVAFDDFKPLSNAHRIKKS